MDISKALVVTIGILVGIFFIAFVLRRPDNALERERTTEAISGIIFDSSKN